MRAQALTNFLWGLLWSGLARESGSGNAELENVDDFEDAENFRQGATPGTLKYTQKGMILPELLPPKGGS